MSTMVAWDPTQIELADRATRLDAKGCGKGRVAKVATVADGDEDDD
jgi:hypothetical protein